MNKNHSHTQTQHLRVRKQNADYAPRLSINRYQKAILKWKLISAKFESFIHFQQMLV